MWFKNLIVYRIEEQLDMDEDALRDALGKRAFKGCGPQEANTMGWVAPMGEQSDNLVHASAGKYLLTARREERVMPAGAVRDAVESKVLEIEQREGRKIGRKQKSDIREDMIFTMMPRAFTRSSLVQGLILPDQALLVVDTTNRNRAEEWINLLRASIGGLPLTPVETRKSVPSVMTSWLNGTAPMPPAIEPGDECELQSPKEERAVVVCRRQDLTGDEVRTHLKAGKLVSRMAIEWKQSLTFVLNGALEIKKLRFADTLVEQGAEDKAAEFDARFTVMALELSRFLPALWEVFGGLEEE